MQSFNIVSKVLKKLRKLKLSKNTIQTRIKQKQNLTNQHQQETVIKRLDIKRKGTSLTNKSLKLKYLTKLQHPSMDLFLREIIRKRQAPFLNKVQIKVTLTKVIS